MKIIKTIKSLMMTRRPVAVTYRHNSSKVLTEWSGESGSFWRTSTSDVCVTRLFRISLFSNDHAALSSGKSSVAAAGSNANTCDCFGCVVFLPFSSGLSLIWRLLTCKQQQRNIRATVIISGLARVGWYLPILSLLLACAPPGHRSPSPLRDTFVKTRCGYLK